MNKGLSIHCMHWTKVVKFPRIPMKPLHPVNTQCIGRNYPSHPSCTSWAYQYSRVVYLLQSNHYTLITDTGTMYTLLVFTFTLLALTLPYSLTTWTFHFPSYQQSQQNEHCLHTRDARQSSPCPMLMFQSSLQCPSCFATLALAKTILSNNLEKKKTFSIVILWCI